MRTALTLGLLLAAIPDAPATAAAPILGVEALAAAVRETGQAGPAIVDDDVDLARLVPPAGAAKPAIVLDEVRFRGQVHGAPSAPLRMDGGSICRLDAADTAFPRAVDLRGVAVGSARLPRARLDAEWACYDCRLCRANFAEAEFRDAATFTSSRFGAPPEPGLCRRSPPPSCGEADFAEVRFAGPARFEDSRFLAAASFDAAQFLGGARFARSIAERQISFIGARFSREAEFRDCMFADAFFGSNVGNPAIIATTEFAARADFRRCRFTGVARFDDAVFAGDGLFAGARFSGPVVSFQRVLPSHSLDLRGAEIGRADAEVRLGAAAADAIRLDWDALGSHVLRGLPPEERAVALDSLSRRLSDAGESRMALAVGFEAKRARRQHQPLCGDDSAAGCAASEAEWWVWTWPTRNGSDPTLPLAVLALLWLATAAAGLPRGRLLLPPVRRDDAEPIYDCLPPTGFSEGTCCAIGRRRLGEACGFATGLVLKLGARRQRLAGPASHRLRTAADLTLRAVWLLGWVMIALVAAVVAASFPGLKALVP
jgi:uncharacterized protein YjbI with pentapeptide repeats